MYTVSEIHGERISFLLKDRTVSYHVEIFCHHLTTFLSYSFIFFQRKIPLQMKPLKIHTITERVILQDTTHQQHQQQQFSSSLYIYEIIYSVEEENYIRIERNLNDIILLVQSVVLYFPSYQFSAGVLFQPPDQQIRNLLDLQEFLNRIFSIDVGTRLIQYPKVIAFFDPVFAKSVTQRSLMKQSLKAVGSLLSSFQKR